MKIFLDFDDVLFETKKFKEDYFKLFERHKISREVFDECYYDHEQKSKNVRAYDPMKHIGRICERAQVDISKIKPQIEMFTKDTSRYVFSDVENFLKNFKRNELYIISYSLTNFQQAKIFNSGIAQLFERVEIVSESKAKAIEKNISQNIIDSRDKIYFVDDRIEHIEIVKSKYPKCITILMKRTEGRYNDAKNKYCDYEAENLNEVQKIIKN